MRVTDRQLTEARFALQELCDQVRHVLLSAPDRLVLSAGGRAVGYALRPTSDLQRPLADLVASQKRRLWTHAATHAVLT